MTPTQTPRQAYSCKQLRSENRRFQKTGGVSQNNGQLGFVPAFCDCATGLVYRSCFANGSPAPIHLLEGLPDELALTRNVQGRITTVKNSVIAGFVLDQTFYTREQAARLAA